MSWYNPLSWQVWSDYGVAAWSEDLESAVQQAEAWTERTAAARGWTDGQLLYAGQLIRNAAQGQQGALDFWRRLDQLWESRDLPGWDELGETWAAAAGAARSTAAGRDAGSIGEVVGGAAAAAAVDTAELADWGRRYGLWVVGALVVVSVVVYAGVAARKRR